MHIKYLKYFIYLLLYFVFIGCGSKGVILQKDPDCEIKVKTIIEQKVDSNLLENVDKIIYSKSRGSISPAYQRLINTIITKDMIAVITYNYYDEIMEEKHYKIDQSKFDQIKLAFIDNNISSCTERKIDCKGDIVSEPGMVGCGSESFILFNQDKKVFSEYKACNRGDLCGDFENLISYINKTISISEELEVYDGVNLGRYDFPSIYFQFDRYTLDKKEEDKLSETIQIIKENLRPNQIIKLVGNTDYKGSEDYNYRLALLMAKSIKDIFVSHGIPEDQIHIMSYGEYNPICNKDTTRCRDKNRRVEINILSL